MRKVESTLVIRTTPETLLRAFWEPEMLRAWWQVERTCIEPRPGGPYILTWNVTDSGFGYVATGYIETITSERLLIGNYTYLNPQRSILGPMTLRVDVKTHPDGVQIHLCQDGYRDGPDWDWYYGAVVQAWPSVLQNLKEYLEKL